MIFMAGERKKARNFGPPTLRAPTLSGRPPLGAPQLRPSLFLGLAPHPLGPHHDTKNVGQKNELAKIGLAKIGQIRMAKTGLAKVGFFPSGPPPFGPLFLGLAPTLSGPHPSEETNFFLTNPMANPILANRFFWPIFGGPKGWGPPRVGPPKGGGGQTQKSGAPWGPELWARSLWLFFRGILVVFVKTGALKCARLEFSGCRVRAPAARVSRVRQTLTGRVGTQDRGRASWVPMRCSTSVRTRRFCSCFGWQRRTLFARGSAPEDHQGVHDGIHDTIAEERRR